MIVSFRKRQRLLAYSATWFGCTADLLLENSAILILFMNRLEASASVILLAVGISSLVTMVLQIPAGTLVERIGPKRGVSISSGIVFFTFLLIASAPWWGTAGKYIVIAGIACHAVSKPLWNVSWYLILGNILRPGERGPFLGTMRFSYYVLNGVIFFLLGIALGYISSTEFLQGVIGGVGTLSLGRILVIGRLRLHRTSPPPKRNLKQALSISLRNSSLVGFSVYTALVCFAFAPMLQLVLIYFKNQMQFGANIVQLISSAGLGGNICASLLYGRILNRFGMRVFQIAMHLLFFLLCAAFFFCTRGMPGAVWICGGLFFCASFAFTCFGCNVSREMLALARPGNEAMATSFCLSYQTFGTALGRLSGSALLGCGCLSMTWEAFNIPFTSSQTLFLGAAAFLLFLLILLPGLPSVIPRHDDYYKP